jgi:hypothetical protein
MTVRDILKNLIDNKKENLPKYFLLEGDMWFYIEEDEEYNNQQDGCGDYFIQYIREYSDGLSELQETLSKEIIVLQEVKDE